MKIGYARVSTKEQHLDMPRRQKNRQGKRCQIRQKDTYQQKQHRQAEKLHPTL